MAKKIECTDESGDYNTGAVKSSKSTKNSDRMCTDYSLKGKKKSSSDEAC